MRKISFIVTIMIIVLVFIVLIISGNSIEIDYSQLQLTSSVENNLYSIPENKSELMSLESICNDFNLPLSLNGKYVREKIDTTIESILTQHGYEIGDAQYIWKREPVDSKDLILCLERVSNVQIKTNIIICLMYFSDVDIFNNSIRPYINTIKISDIVKYAGESLNDTAKEMILLFDDIRKRRYFIEKMASASYYEAIYSIYNYNSDKRIKKPLEQDRRMAIIGLLYLLDDMELLDWLCTKRFLDTVDEETLKEANKLRTKYGWIDELDEDKSMALFLLIYLGKNAIVQYGEKANKELLNNRIAFLLSYIISDEENELYYNLINIEDFEVVSIEEFSYHWNKRKQKGVSFKLSNYIDVPKLNVCSSIIIIITVFLQIILYLSLSTKINELLIQGWELPYDLMENIATIPFNSLYIVVLASVFFFNWLMNLILRKFKYAYKTNVLSVCIAIFLSIQYSSIVLASVFRATIFVSVLLISIIEMVKHRINFPSFKDPQYSKIVEYLE